MFDTQPPQNSKCDINAIGCNILCYRSVVIPHSPKYNITLEKLIGSLKMWIRLFDISAYVHLIFIASFHESVEDPTAGLAKSHFQF